MRLLFPRFKFSRLLANLRTDHLVHVTVFGKRLYADSRDNALTSKLLVHGIWEPEETAVLQRYLRAGGVFVDVGANVGYFTVLASAWVGPAGQVYAFEPEKHNFAILRKNITENRCENVIAENMALAEKSELVQLYLSGVTHSGDHRVYCPRDDDTYIESHKRMTDTVQAITLDEYLAAHNSRVDTIKIDVQGAEYRVLSGMKKTLGDNPGCAILMEYWPHGLWQAGASPQELLEFLESYEFRFYRIAGGDMQEMSRADLLGLGSGAEINLMCARGR